jgi:hypothetical protein
MTDMTYRDLVYKFIAQNPKGKVELVADPHTYYGSDEVGASYILKLHKFKLDGAFVYRLEFEGKTEAEVFEEAYKFMVRKGEK